MGSLLDLLQAGQLGASDAMGAPSDAINSILAMLRPDTNAEAPTPGVAVAPSKPEMPNAITPAPLPNSDQAKALATAAATGKPAMSPAPVTASVAPSAKIAPPAMTGSPASTGGGDFLKTALAFVGGLGSGGGIRAALNEYNGLDNQNATRNALLAKGLDPTMAEAAVKNPNIMQAVAPVLFGKQAGQIVDGPPDPMTGLPSKLIQYPDGRLERLDFNSIPGMNGQASPGGDMGGDMTKTGKDFLASLPAPRATMLQGILEGRAAPPTGRQLATPQGQFLMQQLGQAEPGFDLTVWNARNATNKNFRAGPDAQVINNINTAVNHLGHLYDDIDGLNNSQIWGVGNTVNWVKNAVRENGGDPAITNFNRDKQAALDEMASIFSGQNGSGVGDRAKWEAIINNSQSPAQLKEGIKGLVDLMNGRLQGLADKYNQGMQTNHEPRAFLTPQSQATLDRVTGGKPKDVSQYSSVLDPQTTAQSNMSSAERQQILTEAQAALKRGKKPADVQARLKQLGIDVGAQ